MEKHWTFDEDKKLRRLWIRGIPISEIASNLSAENGRLITTKAAYMRASRIGLKPRIWHAGHRFLEAHAVDDDGTCLIWPFSRNNKGHAVTREGPASRIMCELAHGPPPTQEHEAAHSCGKGHLGCVHPKHLRWATHLENMMDRVEHGTENRGERNGHAKLTRDQVLEIRARHTTPRADLAREFGVSTGLISNIINRHKWK